MPRCLATNLVTSGNIWSHLVTFCPGVGAMNILRSLTDPEAAAESPPDPDDDEGKSSREILMARYLERCSTRAVVVVLMNLDLIIEIPYHNSKNCIYNI